VSIAADPRATDGSSLATSHAHASGTDVATEHLLRALSFVVTPNPNPKRRRFLHRMESLLYVYRQQVVCMQDQEMLHTAAGGQRRGEAPAAPATSRATSPMDATIDETACVVCASAVADALIHPCGHAATCLECALRLQEAGSIQCVVCRGQVLSLLRTPPVHSVRVDGNWPLACGTYVDGFSDSV
jgi:hypothetical protein